MDYNKLTIEYCLLTIADIGKGQINLPHAKSQRRKEFEIGYLKLEIGGSEEKGD